MLSPGYSISPNDLWHANRDGATRRKLSTCGGAISTNRTPGLLPASIWRSRPNSRSWSPALDRQRPIVVACKAGKELSQFITAELRAAGFDASMLEGGYCGWSEAALPLVDRASARALRAAPAQRLGDAAAAEDRPHRLPVADPPLHRRQRQNPVRRSRLCGRRGRRSRRHPLRHRQCRNLARRRALQLRHHAQAVRAGERAVAGAAGADRARRRHRAAGYRAGSGRPACDFAGLVGARRATTTMGCCERGFMVYDALFAWLRFAADERHNWPAKAA